MSESRIETLLWLEWVKSLGLLEIGADERKLKNARRTASFRMLDAMNLTPLGDDAASSIREITSVQMVGRRSWVTMEWSSAELMMLPRGAIGFVGECSSIVKNC